MVINNKIYPADHLVEINNVRYALFTNFYNNMNYIKSLTEIISRHIDCINIDYNASSYTFTIKIKKTSMRKQAKFSHDPNFYYHKIRDIFNEFIHLYEAEIASSIKDKYEDPYQLINYLYNNYNILGTLCHVSCIADNIISIKL